MPTNASFPREGSCSLLPRPERAAYERPAIEALPLVVEAVLAATNEPIHDGGYHDW